MPFAPPPRLPSPPFPPLAYPSSIGSDESNIEVENPVRDLLLGGHLDHNVKELQLQLEKKLQMQLQRK